MGNNVYTLIGKSFDKVNICAYRIKDINGKEINVSVEDAIKLASKKSITNAECFVVDGEKKLVVKEGIHSLETINLNEKIRIILKCRIINEQGDCIAYKATDIQGRNLKITTDKVWELALNGCIENVEATIINGVRALESKNGSNFLMGLPEIETEK